MRRLGVLIGVLVLGLAALVWLAARSATTELEWQEGVGHFGHRLVTIETDDFTYGVRDSVPMWIDRRGSWHDGGWPTCLDREVGTTGQVRFAATQIELEDSGSRPVLGIDCRVS